MESFPTNKLAKEATRDGHRDGSKLNDGELGLEKSDQNKGVVKTSRLSLTMFAPGGSKNVYFWAHLGPKLSSFRVPLI